MNEILSEEAMKKLRDLNQSDRIHRVEGTKPMTARLFILCLLTSLLVHVVPALAGSAEQAPSPTIPVAISAVRVDAPPVSVRFESSQPDLTLFVKTREASSFLAGGSWSGRPWTARVHSEGYNRICTAPCKAIMPAGSYRLGLGDDKHSVLGFPKTLKLEQPSIVVGKIESNKGIRIAGLILGAISLIGGASMMLASIPGDSLEDDFDTGLLMGGSCLMAVGTGLGLSLYLEFGDEAHLKVRPLGVAVAKSTI